MPRGDRTGPEGLGPLTGRRLGDCGTAQRTTEGQAQQTVEGGRPVSLEGGGFFRRTFSRLGRGLGLGEGGFRGGRGRRR